MFESQRGILDPVELDPVDIHIGPGHDVDADLLDLLGSEMGSLSKTSFLIRVVPSAMQVDYRSFRQVLGQPILIQKAFCIDIDSAVLILDVLILDVEVPTST